LADEAHRQAAFDRYLPNEDTALASDNVFDTQNSTNNNK